ncbi:MAG: TIR domain-containing protein, partial [Ktedonobacteraceae bacterium]|nr:TIR domain-containing protein [Ktedonobacteraceae bacterium]
MSEENTPARVFLSYAHADREVASRVQKDLLKRGIAIWRDLENVQAGHDWEEQVREAIRTCSGVIYLATPNARGSRIVRGELLLAKTYGKPIYPVWATGQSWPDVASLEDISSHYIDIRASQYEDGLLQLVAFLKPRKPSGDDGDDRQREVSDLQRNIAMNESIHVDNEKRKSPDGLRAVMHALRRFFSGTPNARMVPKASRKPHIEVQRTAIRHRRNPYKGLKAFTTEEARDFFGREKLIDTMVAEIKHILTLEQRYANRQEPRFLTVVGPSGSGKSSVVMAGLVPSLQQGKVIVGSESWTFLSPMRPGKDPLEALAQTLLPVLPGNVSMRTILDNLHDESMRALHWYASDIARQQGSRVVLVVDQLEELFTETDETLRQHFIDLLAVAATEPENKVIVIVTMRADFSDHPMKYQLLHRIMEAHRIAIPPMTVENLRAVIERPAFLDDVQVRFEENLVGDLLLDIHGQEENLPLLQFTLEKLFEARHDDLLTLEAYEALGRVQGALSKHAEEVYESLPSEQHHLLAEALFTRLINPGGLEQDATRRRVLRSEFTFADHTQHRQMQETIQTFIDARLITANEIVSENAVSRRVEMVPIIEISHEALISAWERLADWIKGEHDDMRLRQTLNYDIEQWQERKQHPKFLYSGARLKDGQVWARRNILTEREAKFLEVSRYHQRSKHMRYAFMSIALVMALILILIPVFNFVFPRIFTTIVTNTDDSGPGSLRAAIANASPDSTITFASFVHGNIVLRSDLNIAKRLTLNGPADPGQIVITNRQNRSDKSGEGYNIHIYQNASVTISHLSFKNAFVQQRYFIENQGTLTFDHC